MTIHLQIPDSLKLKHHTEEYRCYLQAMLNRILVGELRYGPPNRRKRYMRRMSLELRAYRRDGNFEQLLNLCNYAYLESVAPENKKLYFDPAAASATREELGGAIA
jgi:hypothetical protein